jgi:tetratricopeptide (TPR) repeat protein
MPARPGTDIAHVAVTDHRILRTPRDWTDRTPERVESGSPLVLLNGETLGPGEREGLGLELGAALTFEAETRRDSSQRKRLAYLASTLLDRAEAERRHDVFTMRMCARAMAVQGKLAEAVRLDEIILRSAPDHEQVLEERVRYAIGLNETRPALDRARRAVALNPLSAVLHERLAHIEMREKDWAAAIRESREALRLDPFLRFARMFLIESLLRAGDRDQEARREFEILSKLFPDQRAALEEWFSGRRKRGVN